MNNNQKTNVIFIPGLAANSTIFDRIILNTELYECHYVNWIIPKKKESLLDYTKRLLINFPTKEPFIVIGVSFGGIIAQEINKIYHVKQTIIISSVKKDEEMPYHLNFIYKYKLYLLFPSRLIKHIGKLKKLEKGNSFFSKKIKLYNLYLNMRNPKYLDWAIKNVLSWRNNQIIPNLIHIHGNKDEVFPISNIKNCIIIEKGTHAMIVTKSSLISKVICEHIV